jgi:hypothetical protein
MLTLDREETASAIDYGILNSSIKETFTAIDRFESQAVDEILLMRSQQVFKSAGYKSFEEYCTGELSAWGGYRRINQLLGARKVIEAAGEFGEHIKNERQARPLLRLLREPLKLRDAVALALEENPSPSESDFAAAARKLVPSTPRRTKRSVPEPLVLPETTQVKDEQREVNNTDLDISSVSFPSERTYPPEYTEVLAQIKEQHKLELERLEQELKIGMLAQAQALASEQVIEQLSCVQKLYQEQKEQNIQLQQRLHQMESLGQLETENQQLKQRIEELERAVEERPQQQWGNTMTQQTTKALNKQVKQALEKTVDLRSLAVEPPKENATECLRLLGMALKQIATAMNNTQAMEAAAIILGSSPTKEAIALRAEQLQMLPQAVSDIRRVLLKPGCNWQGYWAVAEKYQSIEKDYSSELTLEETELITALKNVSTEPDTIGVGSIVAHADPYRTLYMERGEVVEDLGDEVIVAWDCWRNESKKTDRYFKSELRFWFPE